MRSAGRNVREWARDAVMANIGLKTIALLCSILIFVFIHGADQISRPVSVGVIAVLPPAEAAKHLMSPLPAEIDVRISGSRTLISTLRMEDIPKLVLHLEKAETKRLEFLPANFVFPPGIHVEEVYHPPIDLRWDDVIEKEVDVRWNRVGDLGDDRMIRGEPVLEPRKVKIRGPRSVLETVVHLETAVTPLGALPSGAIAESVALVNIPSGVTPSTSNILVRLEVGPKLVSKVFSRLKVDIVGAGRAVASPRVVTVEITAPSETIRHLAEETLSARADLTPLAIDPARSGSSLVPVTVDVPGATVRVTPSSVVVRW